MIEQREMTLEEWCQRLPPNHLANKQLRALKALGGTCYELSTEYKPTFLMRLRWLLRGVTLVFMVKASTESKLQEIRIGESE